MVECGSEGVDVRAEILGPTLDRLRRDVIGGCPDFRSRGLAALGDESQAEIDDLHISLGIEQDVARLDIPVDQPCCLRALEPFRHLDGEREKLGLGNPALFPDLVLEVPAGDKLHRNIEPPESPAGGQDADDIRVAEGSRQPGFLLEGHDPPFVAGVFLAEDFQRHFAAQGLVVCDENGAHPPDRMAAGQDIGAELLLDPVLRMAPRADDPGIGSHARDVHGCPARITHYDFLFASGHIAS